MAAEEKNEFLIVTGMSGAGRSTVANALEDLGWYVVDNLPPQMLRPLLDLTGLGGGALPRLPAVVDVRGTTCSMISPKSRRLRSRGSVRVVFLDASDDVLVRRFESCAARIRCRRTVRCSTASGSNALGSRWYARRRTSSSTRHR